jgi:coproporphyrinogen III oxidase-like Fe-S oxidoreductase
MTQDGLTERVGSFVALTERGRFLARTVCTAFDRYFQSDAARHAAAV